MNSSLTALTLRGLWLVRYALYGAGLILLAYWAVHVMAPAPLPTPQTPPVDAPAASEGLRWQLFGSPTSATTLPKIELLGIVLSARKATQSRVALSLDGQKKVVPEGTEITPGLRVKTIKKNEVVLLFQGQEQVVKLPPRPNSGSGAGTTTTIPTTIPTTTPISQAPNHNFVPTPNDTLISTRENFPARTP